MVVHVFEEMYALVMSAGAQVLPAEPVVCASVAALDDLPADQLGAALAGLALPALTGTELVLALVAARRLRNHVDGLIYQYAREILRRGDEGFAQRPDPSPDAPASVALAGVNEIRAALDLSREQAIAFCHTARRLDGALWPLQEAMLQGRLDAERVRIFDRETSVLSDREAEGVAIDLSYPAPNLTRRELTEQIRQQAIMADPEAAARRHRAALARRRVEVRNHSDGTSSISGRQLPVFAAAMAAERLDALARAARAAGHPGALGNLRAEVFLGKLSGRFDFLEDEDIVNVLIAEARGFVDDTDDASGAGTSDPGASHSGGDGGGSGAGGPGAGADAAGGSGSGGSSVGADGEPGAASDMGASGGAEGGDGRAGVADRWSMVEMGVVGADLASLYRRPADGDEDGRQDYSDEVWVRLDWLRRIGGHDDDAGLADELRRELADGDCVDGDSADGDCADEESAGEESAGETVCFGSRADRDGPARRAHGRGLRLVADLTTIVGLNERPATLLGWNALHADLARRIASTPNARWWYVLTEADGTAVQVAPLRRRPPGQWAPGPTPDPTTTDYRGLECWLRLTRNELSVLREGAPPDWSAVIAELTERIASHPEGPPNGNPRRRHPSAALRRWIGIRDGVCVFPTCDTPAQSCDIDHTVDFAQGGETVDDDLAPLCPADHLAKHNDGWKCFQLKPGHIVWISPFQIRYEVVPPQRPGMPAQLIRTITRKTPPDTYLGVAAEPPPPF